MGADKMAKKQRGIAHLVHYYHSKASVKFKPENFNEIPRIFGPEAAIDLSRLVCQHQQNVGSAYMRRLRRDKVKQRDVYFNRLQNIPLKIRRIAVGPNYVDPYLDFKMRLPKLGRDDKIKKSHSPTLVADEASPYVSHNSLAPHLNVLFKMNPGGSNITSTGTTNNNNNNSYSNNNGNTAGVAAGKGNKKVEDDLPFSLSPRKAKVKVSSELPPIKKRFTADVETNKTARGSQDSSSTSDSTPRCPTNTPRNAAFWSFNIPSELNMGQKKSHVSSIPRNKDALAAISSVQKHNKPLPVLPAIPSKAS